MKNKNTTISKFKEWINDLFKDEEKSFNAPTADGSDVTISDDNGDGIAEVGDTVNNADGPMVSATINMQDGSTIVTDETGKITSITPKEEEKPAEETPAKSVEDQLTEAKEALEAKTKEHQEDMALAQKTIESLNEKFKAATEQLSKYKSVYVPKTSGEQFKTPEKKETLAEYKARIEAQNKK